MGFFLLLCQIDDIIVEVVDVKFEMLFMLVDVYFNGLIEVDVWILIIVLDVGVLVCIDDVDVVGNVMLFIDVFQIVLFCVVDVSCFCMMNGLMIQLWYLFILSFVQVFMLGQVVMVLVEVFLMSVFIVKGYKLWVVVGVSNLL